jgi:VanZ family protein
MPIFSNIRAKIFVFYWLPVILYCLLIFIQSSYPATDSLPTFPHADKLVHAGGYALLGFLFYRAYGKTDLPRKAVRLLMVSGLSAMLYGISDEIHQYFVPSRTADIIDMIADAAGGFMGAAAAWMIWRRGGVS